MMSNSLYYDYQRKVHPKGGLAQPDRVYSPPVRHLLRTAAQRQARD
ncbi:hypothetical protein LP419_03090 [Massilia sp. H-1]|nr:hypothetical protein LP419_03090 [Massilia sp. H-1]